MLPKCKSEYEQIDDYQLLQRAIDEQTKNDDKGNRVSKTKEDRMRADILQNPSDPDATYRSKAGKSHKGYSANVTINVRKAHSFMCGMDSTFFLQKSMLSVILFSTTEYKTMELLMFHCIDGC